METVLESKLIDNMNSINSFYPLNFYSLYSFKQNRQTCHNSNLVQYLERESTLNKDFSITTILSNVCENNEGYLRESLAKRIEKGVLTFSNTGNVSNFNLGFKKDETEIESVCYYYVHRPKDQEHELIICFVIDDSKYNLDLFRTELDFYVKENLLVRLERLGELSELKIFLENWFDRACKYFNRIIKVMNDTSLGFFLEMIFSCYQFEFDDKLDQKLKSDLNLFINALSYAFETKSCRDKTSILWDENKNLVFSTQSQSLSEFSIECAKSLIESISQEENIFNLKQIIENYKLSISQELNKINRYLRKAESNYYDIFRVYVYLKNSSMNSILVKMHKNGLNFNDPIEKEDKLFDVVIRYYESNQMSF